MLNLTIHAIHKRIQMHGVKYNEVQNKRESLSLFRFFVPLFIKSFDLDSNFHSEDPSSFTWFHHLRPTNNRPVTFLTVQKSQAKQRMIKTKSKMK